MKDAFLKKKKKNERCYYHKVVHKIMIVNQLIYKYYTVTHMIHQLGLNTLHGPNQQKDIRKNKNPPL